MSLGRARPRRRPGRRPRSESRRLTIVVGVRMTTGEFMAARALADEHGISVPELMRRLLEALLARRPAA